MKKLVLVLASSTLIFGASTLYLWKELDLERSRQVATVGAPTAKTQYTASRPSAEPAAVGQKPEMTPASNSLAVADEHAIFSEEDMKTRRETWARQFLARAGDPGNRAKMLTDSRESDRHEYEWARKHLSLSDDAYEQLVDLRARQDLAAGEAISRCTLDPNCPKDKSSVDSKRQQQELSQLLGAERARQFTDYLESSQERQLVGYLRAKLTDEDFMSSALSETLVGALHDESRQAMSEAHAAGQDLATWNTGYSTFFYAKDATPEQKVASAEAYAQRQHARAAQILNPQQLMAFDALQSEALARLRQEADEVP
jgi:hypothetical protein